MPSVILKTSIELYLSFDERLVFLSVVNDGEEIPQEDQQKVV